MNLFTAYRDVILLTPILLLAHIQRLDIILLKCLHFRTATSPITESTIQEYACHYLGPSFHFRRFIITRI